MDSDSNSVAPRTYQIKLMEIALKQNSIIYLPTGSGKTFIAILILKQIAGQYCSKTWGQGGKLTIMLVNTVALVEQQAQYFRRFIPYSVGAYSGDMQVDSWSREMWHEEFKKNQVLVMTCQILVNIVDSSFLSLNDVCLLIFDECHHGVNDHAMRVLMANFKELQEKPRVIGLTATLINKNVLPHQVGAEIEALETTFHSKIAATDELENVLSYSTNPIERIQTFSSHARSSLEVEASDSLSEMIVLVQKIHLQTKTVHSLGPEFKLLRASNITSDITRIIQDVIFHIQTFGIFGGKIALIAHTIQLERIKKNCQDKKVATILQMVMTSFMYYQKLFENAMKDFSNLDQIYKFSSDQVLVLIDTIKDYILKLKKPMCGIVFVERRFTAKVLFNVLLELSKTDPELSDLKPNFVVGYNVNPFNDVREPLYNTKIQKKILMNFQNKEINLLVSSNVLEEGVDIPLCSFVAKFDKPMNYCSYVQSKGRARSRDSMYYILVDKGELQKFYQKYVTYQKVEEALNECLIGKNDMREGPTDAAVEEFYNEHVVPPYYVDGPNSAKVTLLSSISLLSRYCLSLPSDKYTDYLPNWFINNNCKNNGSTQIVIELPTICPILEVIQGDPMPNLKLAKRVAALKACSILHQIGELDNELLPKKRYIIDDDVNYFFKYWPKKEADVGTTRKRRTYETQIPKVIQGQVVENKPLYLHVIEIEPKFSPSSASISEEVLFKMYSSELCFGVLSCSPLPQLCSFFLYVTQGELFVNFKVNQKTVILTREELGQLRKFHFLVFNDVLKILKSFLMFDNDDSTEGLLVVPIHKNTVTIDFELSKSTTGLVNKIDEPSHVDRRQLEVYEDNYYGTIVSPWYRHDEKNYLVVSVCTQFNSSSKFPSDEFDSYSMYFKEKYHTQVLNPKQPLLLVKGLSKRLNCLKPRGNKSKRNRDKIYEDFEEHLIAELCVKHNFPACLWVQANLLPSILHRVTCLLQADELRTTIAEESGLGLITLSLDASWKPLEIDVHSMEDLEKKSSKPNALVKLSEKADALKLPDLTMQQLKLDFGSKGLELEYPWQEKDEPIDIERSLDVNLMDIQYYENFVSQPVGQEESRKIANSPKRNNYLAITFMKNFVMKNISLLDVTKNSQQPQLTEIFQALTTLKANEVVNMERLETLGDSFLKVACSLFIILHFPKYDEGKSTTLKGRLVSNKNLYYIGVNKNIPGILKASEFTPTYEWKPPHFCIPKYIQNKIDNNEIDSTSILKLTLPYESQVTGEMDLVMDTEILPCAESSEENQDNNLDSMLTFVNKRAVTDKAVADSVEALIGVYFKSHGFVGGLKLLDWLELVPKSKNIEHMLKMELPNPVLNLNSTLENIDYHLPTYKMIEEKLGYTFKNRAYLLQALTHSSYTSNRITNCYQRLEFLGDSILDFLITCYIYETSDNLNPGELTDLRSALVNNITFAAFTVRCEFHKFLLFSNNKLSDYINNFVEFQEARGHIIDDEVLTLMKEDELYLADHVDVPKVLGDLFETLAGAVFLDSGMSFHEVWSVFYRIMWKEIEMFRANIPKNSVRLLYETIGAHPEFHKAVNIDGGRTMVTLEFMYLGAKKMVYGFGENKILAKKAAAKIALRFLSK